MCMLATGMTTDTTGATVQLCGMTADPCSGETKYSQFTSNVFVKTNAPKGRWIFTLSQLGLFDAARLPAIRNIEARLIGGAMPAADSAEYLKKVANGFTAHRYQAPIGDFIFAEPLNPGNKFLANNFEDFPYLVDGAGPFDAADPVNTLVKRLEPWPGSSEKALPAPVVCLVPGEYSTALPSLLMLIMVDMVDYG